MNMRSTMAEFPVSCQVITAENKDRIRLGPMQIKRFFLKKEDHSSFNFSEQDLEINSFLADNDIYILNFTQGPMVEGSVTTVTFRRVLGIEKENISTVVTGTKQYIGSSTTQISTI